MKVVSTLRCTACHAVYTESAVSNIKDYSNWICDSCANGAIASSIPQSNLTANELIDLIAPDHGRTSCSDAFQCNGLFSRNGKTWHGRCARCILLEIVRNRCVPEDFDFTECSG